MRPGRTLGARLSARVAKVRPPILTRILTTSSYLDFAGTTAVERFARSLIRGRATAFQK